VSALLASAPVPPARLRLQERPQHLVMAVRIVLAQEETRTQLGDKAPLASYRELAMGRLEASVGATLEDIVSAAAQVSSSGSVRGQGSGGRKVEQRRVEHAGAACRPHAARHAHAHSCTAAISLSAWLCSRLAVRRCTTAGSAASRAGLWAMRTRAALAPRWGWTRAQRLSPRSPAAASCTSARPARLRRRRLRTRLWAPRTTSRAAPCWTCWRRRTR